MYCILDIESSGGPFGREAIIEIAAFRYDGSEITDQLISLVKPHRGIQKFVTKITGIDEKMLRRAPQFQEIAKRLIELTEDAIIVGHNAKFDYRMLRQEYARLGYPYERSILDTIPIAQELIPNLTSYGLDTVCEELGIYRNQRHRAEGDARATLDLFKILMEKDRHKKISVLGQSIVRNDHMHDKLHDLARGLKHKRGIFYIHDKKGTLLYIDTSQNIKDDLNNLFLPEGDAGEELRQQAYSVKTEATGSALLARVKSHQERQRTRPKLQQALPLELHYGIFPVVKKEKLNFSVKPLSANAGTALLQTESQAEALRAIRLHKRKFTPAQGLALWQQLQDFPEEAILIGRGRSKGEQVALIVSESLWQGYHYFKLHNELRDPAKLKRNMVEVSSKKTLTPMLKTAILAGDFVYYEGVGENEL